MFKRFISFISALLLFQAFSLFGQDNDFRYFEVNGIRYKVLKESDEASTFGTVSVCKAEYAEYAGDIVIPLTVKEYDDAYSDVFKVVSIEDHAFQDTPRVSTVQLPVSIESIGRESFKGCGATSITIPMGSLSKIGAHAFSDSKITSVSIPSSVKTIGVGTFMNCTNLESATLSDNLRAIPDSAFYQCHSLRSVVLPNRAASIGNCAFLGCVNMGSFQFNEIVKSIGTRAFADCVSLRELALPESLYEIGMGAFSRTGLYEITIPSKIKTLREELFSGSTVRKINLKESLATIEANCFTFISTYKIDIPDNVDTHSWAFNGYKGEYDPADKIAFDEEVRKNLKKAKSVVTVDDITVYGIEDIGRYIPFTRYLISAGGNDYSVIYNPEPGVEYGQLRLVEWNNGQEGAIRVPDILIVARDGVERKYVVTELGSEVFHTFKYKYRNAKEYQNFIIDVQKKNTDKSPQINSIEIGYFVKNAGPAPFYDCTAKTIKMTTPIVTTRLFTGSSIESYEFPKGTEEIPDGFFSRCKNLKNITIPPTVKKIGKQAFYETCMTKIVIPEGVEIIGDEAFNECENLNTVSLPSSLNEIGYRAFYGCHNLKNLTLPSSLSSIGKGAFYHCGFEEFFVPKNISTICKDTYEFFAHCDNLKKIEFAPGTTIIPRQFCILLSSLETIILPDTLEEIGDSAFGKTSIKSLSLPSSVKVIGDSAFYDCPIECVVIPSSVKEIGRGAFKGTKKVQLKCDPKLISTKSYNGNVNEDCIVEVLE